MRRLTSSILLMVAVSGCIPMLDAGPKARTKPPRQAMAPEDRLVLMPYGTYKATSSEGSAALTLGSDQRFNLSWTVKKTGIETQWSGSFEWLAPNGSEALELYGVREAVEGRVRPGTRDVRQALTRLDKDAHTFALDVPTLGRMDFKP